MITAIIQARMSSTRLPGKVLLPLGDRTVLEQVVFRTRQAKKIGRVVVATSTEPEDDSIAALCKSKNIDCFRGSLTDVLDRYYQAAKFYQADNICRITADCPLIAPEAIDLVAAKFLEGGFDQVSNSHPVATFPDGYDTWIFSFAALEKSWTEAKLPSEREHVTAYMWNHPEIFKIFNLKNDADQSQYRLTIDNPEDYELLQNIFKNVPVLSTENIIGFLDKNQDIKNLNIKHKRDEGYAKSLADDKKIYEKE